MKLSLILLLCLTGLDPVARSTTITFHHKYHLIKQSYTWLMAQSYCRVMYTDLATIITDDDWVQLKKEAASKGFFTGSAWIGLYNDVNSWRWTLNELPLKSATYTNWHPGEPNNSGGREACAVIYGSGVWADYPCTYLCPFICYNASFSGSAKFISISTRLSWIEAQNYCRTHHTDLASSLNSSDNNLLLQLRDLLGNNSWIGLYRDTWKWSDGTISSKLSWAPGQPNNQYGNETCASHINNMFYDYFCSGPAYFYCHSILSGKRQIIKLQVKSDGSVFDPVMQSFILEQIKKKLEEKGLLENSTVTWRKQPDGNIFQKKNKDDL